MHPNTAKAIINNEEELDIGQMAEALSSLQKQENKRLAKVRRKKNPNRNNEGWLRHQAIEESSEKLRQQIVDVLKRKKS